MDELKLYLQLGFEHITDLGAYDHILYLFTITVAFSFWHYKQLFWAVTGFTLGHSLTLALSALSVVSIDATITEFAVPVTIMLSALILAFKSQSNRLSEFSVAQFFITICFGLIHGLAFSNQLKMLLSGEQVLLPLLGFNLGVEIGQLLIVVAILILGTIIEHILNIQKKYWALFASGATFGLALLMSIENKFW